MVEVLHGTLQSGTASGAGVIPDPEVATSQSPAGICRQIEALRRGPAAKLGGMAPTAGGETTTMEIPGDAAEDVSEVDSEEAAIEWYAEPLEPRPKRHARPPNRYGFED